MCDFVILSSAIDSGAFPDTTLYTSTFPFPSYEPCPTMVTVVAAAAAMTTTMVAQALAKIPTCVLKIIFLCHAVYIFYLLSLSRIGRKL